MPSGAFPTTGLLPVTITRRRVRGTGARHWSWTEARPVGPNGDVYGAGTQRDRQGRVIPGVPSVSPLRWQLSHNEVVPGVVTWQNGSDARYAIVEAWVLVPAAVGATVLLHTQPYAGNSYHLLRTGQSPMDAVERGIGNVSFAQPVRTDWCTDPAFNLAFMRVHASDGYFRGGIQLTWDIGNGFERIPVVNLVPTDGSHLGATDDEITPCAYALQSGFTETRQGWRDPMTGDLFEADRVTPIPRPYTNISIQETP